MKEEYMDDLSEIKVELADLNARSEERWKAHDKRSDENWTVIREKMDKMLDFIQESGNRKKGCMDEAKKYVDDNVSKAVGLWLGIPVSITALVSVIVVIAHYIIRKG